MNKLILNKPDASADQTTPLQYKNCIVPVCENRKSSLVHKVSKIKKYLFIYYTDEEVWVAASSGLQDI